MAEWSVVFGGDEEREKGGTEGGLIVVTGKREREKSM